MYATKAFSPSVILKEIITFKKCCVGGTRLGDIMFNIFIKSIKADFFRRCLKYTATNQIRTWPLDTENVSSIKFQMFYEYSYYQQTNLFAVIPCVERIRCVIGKSQRWIKKNHRLFRKNLRLFEKVHRQIVTNRLVSRLGNFP